jgi:phage gp46-like protein
MAYDLAIDPVTGDWLFSGNRDFQGVEGEQVIAQRIRTRLRIVRRAWALDPSDGALGSRLEEAVRLPRGRVLRELRLMVDEALAPMSDDIELTDVVVEEEGIGGVKMRIDYTIRSSDAGVPVEDRMGESLTFELPI